MVYENALNVYTDGSSLSHPRRGGIGIRYVTINEAGDEVVSDHVLPGHEGGTNNEMELLACIKALEGALEHPSFDSVERVYIFTDSQYVKNNINRAIYEWSRQRWLNRDGRPVDNAALWQDFVRERRKFPRRVEFKWVKGHSDNPHNRAADKLAKQSARGVLKQALKVATVRRKITQNSVERGSVQMRGQVLAVRIITDTFMKQKIYKYKYEVLSEDSEFRGRVDWIYSVLVLRAGHHYEVLVNVDTKNPRIEEVLRELPR